MRLRGTCEKTFAPLRAGLARYRPAPREAEQKFLRGVSDGFRKRSTHPTKRGAG